MAKLFPPHKLKECAQKVAIKNIADYLQIIEKWRDDYFNGSLKYDKETSREQEYNRNFFQEILGYKEKPNSPYSFEPKSSTAFAQMPDAVIGYMEKANKSISAVVELKGASVSLDRPQRREGNLSPVQQCFKYKTAYRNCPFVIVSNFWEFRLYNDNQLDYEAWTLDDLLNPADAYLNFKSWFVLMCATNFTAATGKSKTEQLISDIRFEQEAISESFYADYKAIRIDLIKEIYSKNEGVRDNVNLVVQKAQKIIDRLVFIAFAEDAGLLPDNSIQRILAGSENTIYGDCLWMMLKGFFQSIDKGNTQLEIPEGYNGGLFKADPDLDNLEIGHEALKRALSLGKYDFAGDLSVNILGHIFEQSISDLEALKKELGENKEPDLVNLGKAKKKEKTKQKEDGIFYTKNYIVRFIVQNTLGAYLQEKEEEIQNEFGLKGDIKEATYGKREEKAYLKYQTQLQQIHVADISCGSGAFLCSVFDFLLAENKRVGDILGNTLFSEDYYIRDILQNNIYGVDINDESVEITKLSLWLKSAQKGKKLTTLDNNIVCGNSLIKESVYDEKAFHWREKFPEIFANDGFDIIVGNPPYGADISKEQKKYLVQTYIKGGGETAISFLKHGFDMLLPGGKMGFIVPKAFSYASNYAAIRKYLEAPLVQLVDCKQAWKEVKLEQVIGIFNKSTQFHSSYESYRREDEIISSVGNIEKKYIDLFNIYLNDVSPAEAEVGKKIRDSKENLGRISSNTRGASIQNFIKETGSIPVVSGNEVQREGIMEYRGYIEAADINGLDIAKIKENSILVQNIVAHIENPVDHIKITACLPALEDHAIVETVNQITLHNGYAAKAFWLLLNSKLMNWYLYRFIYGKAIRTMHFDGPVTQKLPIPDNIKEDQKLLVTKADELLALIQEKKITHERVRRLLVAEFDLIDISPKLAKWWKLSFPALEKNIGFKLTVKQRMDLLELYESAKKTCLDCEQAIDNTINEVNTIVYVMYNLSDKDIAIVEAGMD